MANRSTKTVGCLLPGLLLCLNLALLAALVAVGGQRLLEKRCADLLEKGMSDLLGGRVSVGAVRIDLVGGRFAVYDIGVPQPHGFGAGRSLYIAKVDGRARWGDLMSTQFRLENIRILGARLLIRRNANGMNLPRMLRSWDRDERQEWPLGLDTILIGSVTIDDAEIHFAEEVPAEEDIEFTITRIAGIGRDIEIRRTKAAEPHDPSRIQIVGTIRAPAFPAGRCGIAMQVTQRPDGAPQLKTAVRIIGFELGIVAPLLPKDTGALLGGNAVDVSANLTSAPGCLDGCAAFESVGGYRHVADLGGSLTSPKLKARNSPLAAVLARGRGSVSSLFGGLPANVEGAAEDVVAAAEELAEGTEKTVGSFSSGFFETVGGIVKLDISNIGLGFREMGTAIASDATTAVVTAGGQIIEGGAKLPRRLVHLDEQAQEWRNAVPERWDRAWQEAVKWLEKEDGPE